MQVYNVMRPLFTTFLVSGGVQFSDVISELGQRMQIDAWDDLFGRHFITMVGWS